MATYKCKVCGYIHKGDAPPEKCPVCKQPASVLKKYQILKKQAFKKQIKKNMETFMYIKMKMTYPIQKNMQEMIKMNAIWMKYIRWQLQESKL